MHTVQTFGSQEMSQGGTIAMYQSAATTATSFGTTDEREKWRATTIRFTAV